VDHVVPVLPAVASIIANRPKAGKYVFSTNGGRTPFSGFSKAKSALDARIIPHRKSAGLKQMQKWQTHDLRRTARSLMSRCGVSADTGERVLGHLLPGVRKVYDRHDYFEEKQDALRKLEALVQTIVLLPLDNVVTIRGNNRSILKS
jgi:integrase